MQCLCTKPWRNGGVRCGWGAQMCSTSALDGGDKPNAPKQIQPRYPRNREWLGMKTDTDTWKVENLSHLQRNRRSSGRPAHSVVTVTPTHSRINSTKSPAPDAGNISEPRLISQVGGVRVGQCFSAIRAVETSVLVCLRSSCGHVKEVGRP